MKTKFTTLDIRAVLPEIRAAVIGLRVANIYDVNNKTYLLKLAKPDNKRMLLFESGVRMHLTEFEWPKHQMPSNFTMKLRKHLRTRRCVNVSQLGIDRVVDLQFGYDEAAYHIVVELYDRGNVILTDYQYTILNLLRVRTDVEEDVVFAVRETYPVTACRQLPPIPDPSGLHSVLSAAPDDLLVRAVNHVFPFGIALTTHCLCKAGISEGIKVREILESPELIDKVIEALRYGIQLADVSEVLDKGFIILKKYNKPKDGDTLRSDYEEFQPYLFSQLESRDFREFSSFNVAVDSFYSQLEGQKIDQRVVQQEKGALKKLSNVKKDHERRLEGLAKSQQEDKSRADLILYNVDTVDRAIIVVNSFLSHRLSWKDVEAMVDEAKQTGDKVASAIMKLQLERNKMTLKLEDPYVNSDEEEEASSTKELEIDLGLSAYCNATKYYDHKRFAAKKQEKTIAASEKALKAAQRKTKEKMKAVDTITNIQKARKTFWWEKFFWFISSDNLLVIGGRDSQQNELIVKRHLRGPSDVYVHADLHGASSIVVKNPGGQPPPARTLEEAGTMAVCLSAAWAARVVTSGWWVHHHQVSKTAPTGEYLTTGAVRRITCPTPNCCWGSGFSSSWRRPAWRGIKGSDSRHLHPTRLAEMFPRTTRMLR